MVLFDSHLDPPESLTGVCCPVCGIELDESDVTPKADGTREWMCNVCGETGVWDAEPEEDDPITDTKL